MEVLPDCLGSFAGDDGGERIGRGLLDVAQAAEVRKQALAGLRADAGNLQQLRVAVAHGAALAMVAHSEAMALVANELDEVQYGAVAVEDDGLVFAAMEIDDLFLFGDGGIFLFAGG